MDKENVGTDASRKRNNACTVSEGTELIENLGKQRHVDNAVNDPTFWREKYEALERDNDEQMQDLQDQALINATKERKLNEYIRLLEEKCGGKLPEAPVSAASSSAAATADASEAASLRQQLQRYKLLTGMSVEPSADKINEFVCTVRNRAAKKLVKFAITMPAEGSSASSSNSGECSHRPMANTHSQHLPAYLTEGEVEFEAPLAPALLGDVLTALYADDDEAK